MENKIRIENLMTWIKSMERFRNTIDLAVVKVEALRGDAERALTKIEEGANYYSIEQDVEPLLTYAEWMVRRFPDMVAEMLEKSTGAEVYVCKGWRDQAQEEEETE